MRYSACIHLMGAKTNICFLGKQALLDSKANVILSLASQFSARSSGPAECAERLNNVSLAQLRCFSKWVQLSDNFTDFGHIGSQTQLHFDYGKLMLPHALGPLARRILVHLIVYGAVYDCRAGQARRGPKLACPDCTLHHIRILFVN